MFSPRTRVTIFLAVAIAWMPASASGQIKVGYASEAAVELAGGKGVTIAIEGAGFDRVRGVVVTRDAAGRDRITEITGSFRGDAVAGYLTLALGGAAPPGTYYLFLTDGRQLAPVPIELTVPSANEPPMISGVMVDASAEPNQPFTVTVNAQDDRGLSGIEWDFAGVRGTQSLPPAKVGFEQTSATFTFELTTNQIGTHTLAVTAFDVEKLPSDVVEAFVTVESSAPPSEAPVILSNSLTVVENGTPVAFEWSAVAGAQEYTWYLTEIGPVMTDGNYTGTVSGLSANIVRTPVDHVDYYFTVRAVNAGGIGPLSEVVQLGVRAQPLEQPILISSYSAIQGQPDVAAGESFTFEWTPVPNAMEYQYCLSQHLGSWTGAGEVNSPSCDGGESASVSATSASFGRVGSPTSYYFTVTASRIPMGRSASRNGPYSELASIVVGAQSVTWEILPGPGGAEAPTIPISSSYRSEFFDDSFTLRVMYQAVPGQDSYEFCYNRDNSATCLSAPFQMFTASQSFQMDYLDAGCEHYFKVRVVHGDGTFGPYSDTIHATLGSC